MYSILGKAVKRLLAQSYRACSGNGGRQLHFRTIVAPRFAGRFCVFGGFEIGLHACLGSIKKWGITTRRIQTLLNEGRIPGTGKAGTIWLIPIDAEKPNDARVKNGKYVKTDAQGG